jgi:hypothetical protein
MYPDEESFWNAFSDENGNKFSYQQMLDRFTDRRMTAAMRDAVMPAFFSGGT